MKFVFLSVFLHFLLISFGKKCPSNCQSCTAKNNCTLCNTGYFLGDSSCNLCAESFLNCRSCSSSFCTQCNSGYFLNENLCEKCIPDCNKCNNTSGCLMCESNYYYDGEKCKSCSIFDEFCSNCDGMKCTKCQNGYYFNDNSICSSCKEKYGSNCKNCDKNSCLGCIYGHKFFLNNYTCEENCSKDFYQVENICYHCYEKISNCAYCNNEKCTKCLKGYSLFQNSETQCVKKAENTDKDEVGNSLIFGIIFGLIFGAPLLSALAIIIFTCIKNRRNKVGKTTIIITNPIDQLQLDLTKKNTCETEEAITIDKL